MKKIKQFFYITLSAVLILLLLNSAVAAEFFQGELKNFVQSEHGITLPIFEPKEKIKLKAVEDTIIYTAEDKALKLKKGEVYYLSQFKLEPKKEKKSSLTEEKIETTAEKLKESKSFWGLQLLASSDKAKAEAFKNKTALKIEAEIFIIKEDSLFKVIAGKFNQRSQADFFKKKLKSAGFDNFWTKEFFADGADKKSVNLEADNSLDLKNKRAYNLKQENNSSALILSNQKGHKLIEGDILKIKGIFAAEEKKFTGKYIFAPLAKSVLFSYKTDLEELSAFLLQHHFNPGAPEEALKAQAVIYRTNLLYQLEIEGSRLESLSYLNFDSLSPIFKEAAAAVKNKVLIKEDSFYYNDDFSLRKIKKPKAGIIPLAQAGYSFPEIINYYYNRSQIKNLDNLLDSKEKFTARIERGLYFKEIRQLTWQGPRVLTVIDYDLNVNTLTLKPVLARGAVSGREDLADLINKHSALAGVNGGYFHYSGRPLGLLYIEGELVSEPLYNRTALLITKDGKASFSRVGWDAKFKSRAAAAEFNINGVNREVKAGEIVLFNYFYGYQLPPLTANYYDIVIRDDHILGIESKKGVKTPIPPDGYVLRVSNLRTKIRDKLPQINESQVSLNYNFSPNFKENNILHAVGGGPRLLSDSKIAINGAEEKFQDDIIKGRAPRTAVALTEADHLLFLTIDGRQSDYSIGMTLAELAAALQDLGAVDAVNLDGGGSARMVIRGFTMSNPSQERLISNGVLLKEDK